MAKRREKSGRAGKAGGRRRRSVYSGLGGQAVLEGVMMRHEKAYAIAVRRPDGEIEVRKEQLGRRQDGVLRKIPFLRGIFILIDSLTLGMDSLTWSSSFYEEDEGSAGEAAADGLLDRVFGDRAETVAIGLTVVVSVALALLLFLVLPYGVSELLGRFLRNRSLVLLIEGLLRILIFVAYVAGIALMKDIRRLYQYHGAEHKCINCVESGRPLTVRNVMRTSRFHKRCGTSFMLMVVLISVVLCFFIRVEAVWMRLLLRLLLIPVVAGVSYELIRLAGTREGALLDVISAPGIWLQHVTTREPEEAMVEVAIASVEAVYDWRTFQQERFKSRRVKRTRLEADGRVVETGEETLEITVLDREEIKARTRSSAGAPEDGTDGA